MNRNELFIRLDRLDEEVSLLFDAKFRFRLVIVGGGALVYLNCIQRATLDIDALDVSYDILHLLKHFDIDCRVNAYMNNFPYNCDDRLIKLDVGGRRIDFYSLSLEDIIISKLYSSRAKDWDDITNEHLLQVVDWDILERLALDEDEAKASRLNDRVYSEFMQSYLDYIRRYRK